jgi:hypothetical protein
MADANDNARAKAREERANERDREYRDRFAFDRNARCRYKPEDREAFVPLGDLPPFVVKGQSLPEDVEKIEALEKSIATLEAMHCVGFCSRYSNGDSCRESDDCITEWCFGCLLEANQEQAEEIKRLRKRDAFLRRFHDRTFTDEVWQCVEDPETMKSYEDQYQELDAQGGSDG